MNLLNKLTVKQRLWANLIIVIVVLGFITLSSTNALLSMGNKISQLKELQETQTTTISAFQTEFSSTLLSMNQYALTLDKNHGKTFNQNIENLKKLNLSLNTKEDRQPIDIKAEVQNSETGVNAEQNSLTNATSKEIRSKTEKTETLTLDKETSEMAEILTNIKKSANSLVFLKTQVKETISFGIDPSSKAILEAIGKLRQTDDISEETLSALQAVESKLEASQSSLARMTSTQNVEQKKTFDQHGLGDSAEPIFELLSEQFEGDFSSQEDLEALVIAREGYQESFNDLADYFKTTKQNNKTISQLSYEATSIVQKRTQETETQTLELIAGINAQGNQIIKQVSIEIIVTTVILIILNILIVDSITAPLSRIRKQIADIAQNGDFTKWSRVSGKNELADISESVQGLLQSVIAVTSEINQVSHSLVKGDLSAKVEGIYQGNLYELSEGFNNSMVQVRDILNVVDEISVQLSEGKLNANINLDKFKGDYHRVMSHLKSAIEVQKASVAEIKSVMGHMNEGSFSQRIEIELPGEYNQLKNYLNESLSNLEVAIDASNKILYKYQNGDFSYQSNASFKGRLNELKTHMDLVAGNVSEMLSKVKQASQDSLSGVSEISSGNQELNERVQVQAATLQNTTSSMEIISSTITDSLNQAQTANQLSTSVKTELELGSETIQKMNLAMQEISNASAEIAEITTTIDSIAFQTNLLALNAAVEAARAGEAGRGFAVVAGEVRTLASRSAEAAQKIREVSENSLSKVKVGIELTEKTTQTFTHNKAAVKEVSDTVSEVHHNLKQQVQGIQEINQTFSDIDRSTQQNASLVEEVASTSMNITSQMSELENAVRTFKLLAR